MSVLVRAFQSEEYRSSDLMERSLVLGSANTWDELDFITTHGAVDARKQGYTHLAFYEEDQQLASLNQAARKVKGGTREIELMELYTSIALDE